MTSSSFIEELLDYISKEIDEHNEILNELDTKYKSFDSVSDVQLYMHVHDTMNESINTCCRILEKIHELREKYKGE